MEVCPLALLVEDAQATLHFERVYHLLGVVGVHYIICEFLEVLLQARILLLIGRQSLVALLVLAFKAICLDFRLWLLLLIFFVTVANLANSVTRARSSASRSVEGRLFEILLHQERSLLIRHHAL